MTRDELRRIAERKGYVRWPDGICEMLTTDTDGYEIIGHRGCLTRLIWRLHYYDCSEITEAQFDLYMQEFMA